MDEKTEETPGGGDAWSAEQWHEVAKDESLWKIAERYYGDGSLYPKIFEANKDVLKDPNKIRVGQRLRIP
ncbi:MAG TPA: LysM peptidoglycan-binding domain-containing protein [Methylomirabilota bacterium]|nr:LysM peptidoglycan-binding domain-containing protein [Methylomirabilota bacterium]